jgi:hypothetical protein
MRLDGEQHKEGGPLARAAFSSSLLAKPAARPSRPANEEDGMARVDFEISGGGTVYLLHPLTRAAHSWIAEHLPADAMRLGDAVAVEWRYIGEAVGGAIADGLRVR